MKRGVSLLVVVGLVVAGCGGGGKKSNRTAAYRLPAATASGDAVAQDAEAKAQARELVTAVEACFVDQEDYSACKKPEGSSVPIGSGPGQAEVSGASTTGYAVVAHSKSGAAFTVKKGSNGALSRRCDPRGKGGCPASGTW